jgi:hypothetical protein
MVAGKINNVRFFGFSFFLRDRRDKRDKASNHRTHELSKLAKFARFDIRFILEISVLRIKINLSFSALQLTLKPKFLLW